MCFSATASFAVATGTGLVGVLAATKVSNWREIPLASMPLIFAAQQGIEGVLWLRLASADGTDWIGPLANIFAVIALVVWPVWSPLAAGLIERDRPRRLAIAVLLGLGLVVALFGLADIQASPYGVAILGRSLSYANGVVHSPLLLGAYVLCTCGPLLLSSHAMLRLFGAIVVAGLVVSAVFYFAVSFSVWCFFAAAGSVMVYLYFAAVPERAATRRAV